MAFEIKTAERKVSEKDRRFLTQQHTNLESVHDPEEDAEKEALANVSDFKSSQKLQKALELWHDHEESTPTCSFAAYCHTIECQLFVSPFSLAQLDLGQ